MIMVTGANGFVGSALLAGLIKRDLETRACVRHLDVEMPNGVDIVETGGVDSNTDWGNVLESRMTLIHLAARVHVMNDTASDPLAEFREINTLGTINLANQAAAKGVRRFIYLSSVKVNGEYTNAGEAFTADDLNIPNDPYGRSKYEAEQGLRELGSRTGMEIVIIRPPLVYGPGVKANFLQLMRWLHLGVPLPLGAINNHRSFVALDNLIDLIIVCITHPSAANQSFLVSDGEDLSTTQLLRRLGRALGKPTNLLPIPQNLLAASLTLLGKGSMAQRLCGSLQLDISKTNNLLGWIPPVTVEKALEQTAHDFLLKQF